MKKNCENYLEYKNEKIYFVGQEDEYKKIKSLIDLCLLKENNNDKEESLNGFRNLLDKYSMEQQYVESSINNLKRLA